MSLARKALTQVNGCLSWVNLELRTLTATKQETERLQTARNQGVFSSAIYPVSKVYLQNTHEKILIAVRDHQTRFKTFVRAQENDVGYEFSNGFFSSPDAEVLYTIVRMFRPRHIVEVGCGNSTKIIRQAIIDGGLSAVLTCIDPCPRQDVSNLADRVIKKPVETLDPVRLVKSLGVDALLFIDTSHEVKPANDVAFIYGCLVPRVPVGTLLHIHDIFLPFEYVPEAVINEGLTWGEQYIVQAMLQANNEWGVLWPGYYLHRTLPGFADYFPHLGSGYAQSLWLRKQG